MSEDEIIERLLHKVRDAIDGLEPCRGIYGVDKATSDLSAACSEAELAIGRSAGNSPYWLKRAALKEKDNGQN